MDAHAHAHAQLLEVADVPQTSSPLFRVIPAEIRSQIFSLALADYPDPSKDRAYQADSIFARPSYFAPRRSDTALLRTCRAIYRETWPLPFALKEQTHWITSQNRAPPEYTAQGRGDSYYQENLEATLEHIAQHYGQDVEIDHLRVFAQMWKLESDHLYVMLSTPRLLPRRLTITIRHTDWWWWEQDIPLKFKGNWIEAVCQALPDSVREVCMELETTQRRKSQVDTIAQQMAERWFFKTRGGAILYADTTGTNFEKSTWSGGSTWHKKRWVRDETEPGRIDYYVVTVPFRYENVVERQGGSVSTKAKEDAQNGVFEESELLLEVTGVEPSQSNCPFLTVRNRAIDEANADIQLSYD